jgi:FKBP-type peptidyl-prolyl cis-trans isomerase 2
MIQKHAKAGDTVRIHYTCKSREGTVLESTLVRGPLEIKIGERTIFYQLERAVIGMNPGETKSIVIPTEKAYGSHQKEKVRRINRDQFPESMQPEVGMQFQIKGENNENIIITVTDVSEASVILDSNHPWAGKDLYIDIELIDITASPDINGAINALDELAIRYGTDKSSRMHNYTDRYFKYFNALREKPLRIVEIGVASGRSLKMWEDFFPNAKLFAIDVNPQCAMFADERSDIYIGDQSNEDFLKSFAKETGGNFDIIIDDGGHMMSQQITSFKILFPHLSPNGIYVIEDLHTSYSSGFGGGMKHPDSTVEFLKSIVDEINFKGWSGIGHPANAIKEIGENKLSYFERYIDSIHFYLCICFIFKRDI